MKKIVVLGILFLAFEGMGQPFRNVKIDLAAAEGGPEEPTISISLANPDIIVAGANIDRLYYSKDGGFNWKTKKLKSQYGVWGDPCVISADNGEFMYFHLSIPKGVAYVDESFLDRIVCQTSRTNGKRFSQSAYMGFNPPKDQDKEWAVFDSVRKRTYVTWTQFDTYGSSDTNDRSVILGSFSDDYGKSWSQAMTLSQISGNCVDDDQTTEGAVPAVGINGEMFVAWGLDEKIYFNTFTPGQEIPQEKVIANQPGGWNQEIDGLIRINGMPVTVSDVSNGPNRGRIYVCWSDQRNGELNTDVFLTSSTDGGITWTEALRVNTDVGNTHQFLPWMTIDQSTGYLYVLYYDRRNFSDSQTEVYMAVSKDGGISFRDYKISESPFTPNERIFFGDYINISAVNGRIRPIWTRYENGNLSIWTAIIDEL